MSRARHCLAAAILLTATGAVAQIATSAPPLAYPLAAEVRLSPEALSKRLAMACDAGVSPAAIPAGLQARAEYAAVAQRMFRGQGAPDLVIEVAIEGADCRLAALGYQIGVTHQVVVRAQDGGEIRRWKLDGEAALLSVDGDNVLRAFANAAADAARKFELALRDSDELKRWMEQRGIRPFAARAPFQERGRHLAFLEGGGGTAGGGDGSNFVVLGRLGVTGQWYLVQGVVTRSTPSFTPRPVFASGYGQADLDTTSIGIEAGPVLRLGRAFEFHGGLGVHRFWGHANARYLLPPRDPRANSGFGYVSFWFSQPVASVFGALQYADIALPRGGRVRLGLEGRLYMGQDVTFPELQRSVSVAGGTFGLYAGVEFPWASAPPAVKGAP